MRKVFKELLKSVPITVFLFFSLNALGALLVYKNGFEFGTYLYFAAAIHFIISVITGFIFHNGDGAYIAFLPLVLIDVLLAAVFRSFHIKTAVIIVITILLYLAVVWILKKKSVIKKRNMNTIRRDYEKIRQKQYRKH